ncbi:MAG TPA: hypothetical protein VL171_06720 [Verrucomicrobiae bacterium]|nr:hypothetical protein [Verrucomicrobiae bacterium]
MGRKLHIELDSNDLGQAVDGLEVRAKAWEDTAFYMRNGESPDEYFMPEECRDAEEAENIARHYRSILKQIREQVEKQSGRRSRIGVATKRRK